MEYTQTEVKVRRIILFCTLDLFLNTVASVLKVDILKIKLQKFKSCSLNRQRDRLTDIYAYMQTVTQRHADRHTDMDTHRPN